MNIALPLASTIVSLVFAVTVLDQFLARRKPYQLVWTIGLFMFFIGTGCEYWTGTRGLSKTVYQLWYLFGATLVAAYLGMGTLYLLTPPRVAHIIMTLLLAASIYATFNVFNVSLDPRAIHYLSGRFMPQGVRAMTPFFNTFGTVALVGGAIYSALVYWRRRLMPHRVVSNVLIAVGALMPALGGTLMRFGIRSMTPFYALELLGIVLIFIGFLRNREVFGLYRFPLIHGFSKTS